MYKRQTVQTSTVQTSTVSSEVSKAIEDNGLKIDKDGNITDKNGKKVEVKDEMCIRDRPHTVQYHFMITSPL